jgi:lipoate-protein ligase A
MSHDTWRLLIDEPACGAANMARDEAILAACAAGASAPTLRLYRWRPACLSLGRFQRAESIDHEACRRAGVAVVRRPSGGRALLHDHELTYALVARADHPLLGGESILATYQQISLALLAGLRRLGVDAELTPVDRSQPTTDHRQRYEGSTSRSSVVGRRSSAACFDAPAAYELTVAGRKLAGSAQVRRDGCLLQHGAIPLSPHADRLVALLHSPPADLATKMIALDQALGRPIDFDEVASALIAGFRDAWGINFAPGVLTFAEQQDEQRLLREKYTQDRWIYAREQLNLL